MSDQTGGRADNVMTTVEGSRWIGGGVARVARGG
jgi:hypothetical protein